MLELKDLYWKNVGRFVDQQTIDFTKLGSLVQVDGKIVKNGKETGRSSGSAKTTVFKALDWLFGISDTPTTILQSRLTKESILVGANLDWDGRALHIERGKKLSITVDGVETTGSSKLTEELLDQIIGMPRDLFRKILHKRQGEGGFFLDMGPTDTHKFLTSCLGLEGEQAKILKLDTQLALLESTKGSYQSAVESSKTGLEATQNAIDSLGLPPTLEISPEAVETFRINHAYVVSVKEGAKEGHQKEMSELELTKPKVETTPFDRSEIVKLENEIKALKDEISALEVVEIKRQSDTKSKISTLRVDISKLEAVEIVRQSSVKDKLTLLEKHKSDLEKTEKDRQDQIQSKINANKLDKANAQTAINNGNRAKEDAAKDAEELKKIRSSICPTCESTWMNEKAKDRESAIVTELQNLRKTIVAGMEAEKKIVALDQDMINLITQARPQLIEGMESLVKNINELKVDLAPRVIPEVEELESQITRLKMDTAARTIPEVTEKNSIIQSKNKKITSIQVDELTHQSDENAKAQEILREFDEKRAALRMTHDSQISGMDVLIKTALDQYTEANNKVKSFEESNKRYSESKAKLDTQKASYESGLVEKKAKFDAIVEEIEVITEAKKLIKSYLSCCFEDALESIGDTATTLIRSIPNMETATIQFDGLKETKEGKIKEEVTPLLSMDGEVGIPIKSISGGEGSAADLGIDLSVIKFIEERTGKGINIFILDEPFNGLDTPCIEDAIEMLRNCSVDKRLLIVEHNPVIAQSIENRITVVRDGLTSNIVQQ